jgi:hypothetical protein
MYEAAPPLRSKEIAERLGRTVNAVTLRGQRMGLGNLCRRKVLRRKRAARFTSDAERRAHQGAVTKARLAERGHPRGAAGMKHSPEVKALLSMKAREMYANPASKVNDPRLRAEWAAKALAAIHAGPPRGGYSRAAGGRRPDLDDRYFRSAWEANYARYLNWRVARGELASWEYETKTFVFDRITRGSRSYTPDFRLVFPDGRHEWHEVKGWMDPKSATKLRRMAKYYPTEVVRVIDETWFRQAFRSGLAASIPGWESGGRGSRGA